MKTLFISDLHLDPERSDIQDCFDQFINSCLDSTTDKNQIEIDAVYILGDLFELWIGDDASIPIYQHTVRQLKRLTANGIKLFVMHGNRDFLMGTEFEKATGCLLIPDLYHLTIQSETFLLSHGDIFCTDDVEYMKFRKMVRDPVWKKKFLDQSIAERIRVAQTMREESKQRGLEKQAEIMDVNQDTVESIMIEENVNTLIHGHTHRPASHNFLLKNKTARRIVLPDWQPDAKVFMISH